MNKIIEAVLKEAQFAQKKFPPMNTAHEGFAILLEEVDELWEHIRTKQGKRRVKAMEKEAVQVAAMAIRFIADICQRQNGQK